MSIRLGRVLSVFKSIMSENKRMKVDLSRELENMNGCFKELERKVIPCFQKKVRQLEDERDHLLRENKTLTDAGIAKDFEIKELNRSKSALEAEHNSHVERVKKESFEAIAFSKSKIETQANSHRGEIASLNRQHMAKLEDVRRTYESQIANLTSTHKEVVDRLVKEREWLQSTHASVLSNADKVQQQFKAQCDEEVKRLEKRYAEAMESANSRLASESSKTSQLLKSTEATYEARLNSANSAREYETKMLQLKLDAAEKSLREAQEKLKETQNNLDEKSAEFRNGESELISARSEVKVHLETIATQQKEYEMLKESNNAEISRLKSQLDSLFDEKSAMSIELINSKAACDESAASKGILHSQLDRAERDARTFRDERDELSGIVSELESEKCRLMSYYDEKCQQYDALKSNIEKLKGEISSLHSRLYEKEEEHYRQMNDLEADKSRLMGYYDEKCLQSESFKKQIKALESEKLKLKSDFREKELEGMQVMNEIEADKSRLMGYYDEKCLQVEAYKKKLAGLEKDMQRLNNNNAEKQKSFATQKRDEIKQFQKEMSDKELLPVKTTNVKKEATDVVRAVSQVVAEYSVERSLREVLAMQSQTSSFVSAQYQQPPQQPQQPDENSLRRIRELEGELEGRVQEAQWLQRRLAASDEAVLSKDGEIEDLTRALEEAQARLQQVETSAHTSAASLRVCESNLSESSATVEKLGAELQQKQAEFDSAVQQRDESIARLNKLVSDLKGSKDELQAQLDSLKADPEVKAKIEKLQAVARGFTARSRVKRVKMHRDAQQSGVLVATNHTKQGDSGWYCAPDGSLYYFVLDENEWILTCGPITRENFEEAIQTLKPKNPSAPGYLKVSNFELVTQTVDQPGELYMSTTNWKLYFAVSVDHLVAENRQA